MSDSKTTPHIEKPEGEKAGWHLNSTSYRFEDKRNKLRQDHIEIPGRGELTYSYCERAASVIIVPVTPEGKIVMIRQYRYSVDAWCLEVPASGTQDTGDADLEEEVRKDLKEEVGATCGRLEYISDFYGACSISDEKCHVILALETVLSHGPEFEQTEEIKLHLVPVSEALTLARSGEIKAAQCALAVLLCEPILHELGYATV